MSKLHPIKAVRKSPPLNNGGSNLQVKRLFFMLVLENIGIIPSFGDVVLINYNLVSANGISNKIGNISDVGSRDQNQPLEQGNHQL